MSFKVRVGVGPSPKSKADCAKSVKLQIKVGRLFKESPAVFIAPILTFTLCLGLGLFGVLYGAHLAENDLRERAHANGEACTSGILSEVGRHADLLAETRMSS